ncbi:MAG: hypothetical protein IJX70_00010 [Clostridia bacterium]|nr:hypothetical protein [Clostridia bacterium]
MKKIIVLLLCMLTLFAFSACSTPIYPGLPDISEKPMKGIEIYCWQDGGEWKCGGTVGTNRMKTDWEIRALQVVTIPEMKRILEQKGLTDCFSVRLVDLSGDEVVYLDVAENLTQIATLEMQLGSID